VAASEQHPGLVELPLRPEDLTVQRAARLLLLLEVALDLNLKKPLDVERLSYYDFFAANPFALFAPGEEVANAILLAGFSSDDLSYQSSGHRFVTRRGRLQADLAFLVARALVSAGVGDRRVVYGLTDQGEETAAQFGSLYAHAYRASARHVLRYLDRLSDTALAKEARARLGATGRLIDLYGLEAGEPTV
jgi:hypothetical protein